MPTALIILEQPFATELDQEVAALQVSKPRYPLAVTEEQVARATKIAKSTGRALEANQYLHSLQYPEGYRDGRSQRVTRTSLLHQLIKLGWETYKKQNMPPI